MVIEMLAAFARQNPAVTATTVIAGTLGIATHALGCAAVSVGAAAARDIGKRIGLLRKDEAGSRLARKLQSDMQPVIDKVIAKIVRASPVAGKRPRISPCMYRDSAICLLNSRRIPER
jgi:hypothetical protein